MIPLGAFAAGAVVAVLLGVFGRLHDPTLSGTTDLGFRTVIESRSRTAVGAAVGTAGAVASDLLRRKNDMEDSWGIGCVN